MEYKSSAIYLHLIIGLLLVVLPSPIHSKVNLIEIYRKEVFDYAVLLNQKPVVVYYTSGSCSSCNQMQRNLEAFAKEHDDKMYMAFVDFDKRPQLQQRLGITSVPLTRTYYKGQMLDEFKGPVWPSIKYITKKMLRRAGNKVL